MDGLNLCLRQILMPELGWCANSDGSCLLHLSIGMGAIMAYGAYYLKKPQ